MLVPAPHPKWYLPLSATALDMDGSWTPQFAAGLARRFSNDWILSLQGVWQQGSVDIAPYDITKTCKFDPQCEYPRPHCRDLHCSAPGYEQPDSWGATVTLMIPLGDGK